MRFPISMALALGVLTVCGCDTEPPSPAQEGDPKARPTSEAVAYVNEKPITRDQVDYLARKLGLTKMAQGQGAAALAKVRESLINSRAMALLTEQSLSADDLRQLAVKVASYREELLVERYLREHIQPEPVGADEVADYYRKHPEAFGGGVEKTFEVLRTGAELEPEQRNQLIRQLGQASQRSDWAGLAGELGEHVSYRKLTARQDILEPPLKGLVSKTAPGTVSPVSTKQGLVIVRVLDERRLAPRPLEEVSSRIRKTLAPLKLKEAVKKASEEARSKVTVRIPD